MNKGFRKNWVSLFLFSLILSLSVQTQSAVAMQKGNVDFSKIVDVFYSALRNVKNLNYYTDEKIVFVIAGQEVSFDVGAGHGNIFSPLKSVAAKVNPIKMEFDSEVTLSGLAKIFVENEVYKNAKDVEIFKWLIDLKLNPVQLFTFKLLILLNTARTEKEWVRTAEEVFCLLFRLSLADEIQFVDKSKRLSSYLPASLNVVLKDSNFGLGEFIDSLWDVIVGGVPSSESLSVNPVQVKAFVFRDEDAAKMVYEKFKNYIANSDAQSLHDQVNSFVKPHGYGVVSMNDFVQFRSDVKTPGLGVNEFAKTMVGYEEFFLSSVSNKPSDLIEQVKSLQGKTPKIIFAHDQVNSEHWVAYISDDMSLINTAKSVLLTLAQSFKEYLQVKRSLASKEEFDATERCRIALEKFARSQDGFQLLSQIKIEIASILSADGNSGRVTLEKQNKERISAAGSEIAKLEKQVTEKLCILDKLKNNILILQDERSKKDVQAKVDLVSAELASLEAQLAQRRKEFAELNSKANGLEKSSAEQVEKDKQNLAKLYKMLEEKQKVGGVPSDKLLSSIKLLEARIAASSGQHVAVQRPLDEKLAVRERVASLLEAKASELSNEMDSRLQGLASIVDLDERVIQELMLDEMISLQKAFINQLGIVAKKIRQDNENAKMLESYRKAFAHVDASKISQEKQDQISRLSLEVGYILDSERQADFVAQIMLRESFAEMFIKDMTQNADKFTAVKSRLQSSLTKVLTSSSYLKSNVKLYKYLWRGIPYAYRTFLECIGVSEQSLG